ncbi:MAG: hypothetical protein ACFHWX_06920 [Bacteroidota bacterium]
MSANCKCLNPKGGGTKCPEQHIALCIRGKDRECHGECIQIPDEFTEVSDKFSSWSENTIQEKVVEHMKEFENDYHAFGSRESISNMLRTESKQRDQGFSGKFEYSTSQFDRIVVNYSFSFAEKTSRRQTVAY